MRKLAPGRTVYCGGRPVRVDQNQPGDAYEVATDPEGQTVSEHTNTSSLKKKMSSISMPGAM